MQSKAKNKYWQAGRRWKSCWFTGIKFKNLDFDSYKYIIGDTIYTEPCEEASKAFDAEVLWNKIQAK